MKNLIFLTALFTITAFTSNHSEKYHAEPSRVMGIYIYVDSYPISDFEVLGTIKKTVSWSGG